MTRRPRWHRPGRPGQSRASTRDPFAALGLPAGPGLTDDEVRAAWRRIASATHPDRADGGDPVRYAAAAAAYTDLRTSFGRGEALAGLAATRRLARLPGRIRRGRAGRLTLRVAAAAAVSGAALAAGAPPGAGPAVMTGAVTWLILTGRHDLGP